jgi:hypothetical protein
MSDVATGGHDFSAENSYYASHSRSRTIEDNGNICAGFTLQGGTHTDNAYNPSIVNLRNENFTWIGGLPERVNGQPGQPSCYSGSGAQAYFAFTFFNF